MVKKRVSFGRVINMIGILIMAISLLGNAFELLSITTFRIMIFFGILVQGIGLIYILKKKNSNGGKSKESITTVTGDTYLKYIRMLLPQK